MVTFAGLNVDIRCPKVTATENGGSKICNSASALYGHSPPRVVRGLRSPEMLIASRHQCKECKYQFLSTDDRVMESLGPFIRTYAPFVITHKSAVTRE